MGGFVPHLWITPRSRWSRCRWPSSSTSSTTSPPRSSFRKSSPHRPGPLARDRHGIRRRPRGHSSQGHRSSELHEAHRTRSGGVGSGPPTSRYLQFVPGCGTLIDFGGRTGRRDPASCCRPDHFVVEGSDGDGVAARGKAHDDERGVAPGTRRRAESDPGPACPDSRSIRLR